MENLRSSFDQKKLTYGKENTLIQDVKEEGESEVLFFTLEIDRENQSNSAFHYQLSLLGHQLNHLSRLALTQDILGFLREVLLSDPNLIENEGILENPINSAYAAQYSLTDLRENPI